MRVKLFGKMIEVRNSTREFPPVGNDAAWAAYLGGNGRQVDATTALQVSAVFRCVDVIAKTMASLPLHLFRETEKGKEKAKEHPLYRLLYVLPNEHTTAYSFWHMYLVNLLLTKGAYARIVRDRRGKIVSLQNIPTNRVSGIKVNAVNGEQYIFVYGENGMETLRTGDFMYTPSMRFTSDADPTDPIAIAADVLGLTMDLNQCARTAFEAGANPGGYVEYPGSISDKAYERFKEDFQKNYAGVANMGKWMYLEQGAKATQFTRDMEKTQALESRKFAVTEICRIFGVPPHLVYDLDRATFSNIEQQSIEFVQNCIAPMAVRLEQTIYKDLLTAAEQLDLFAKFNLNGLLRGDMAARTAYFNSARQNGWLNGDEIRALEDINEMPDGLGAIYTVNGNTIPLSAVPQNLPKGAKTNATA